MERTSPSLSSALPSHNAAALDESTVLIWDTSCSGVPSDSAQPNSMLTKRGQCGMVTATYGGTESVDSSGSSALSSEGSSSAPSIEWMEARTSGR